MGTELKQEALVVGDLTASVRSDVLNLLAALGLEAP